MAKKNMKKKAAAILEPNALVKRAALQLANQSGEWLNPELELDIKNKNQTDAEDIKAEEQTSDLYAAFVRQATRFDRLSEEEERILGLRVRDHMDKKAAKKLVLHNMRLCIKMAHQYRRSWTNLMDLVQEASTGMTIAAKKWDPDKKTRFGTYAAYWIRAQLTKFLMTNARLIHTANTKAGRKIYFNLPKIRRQLLAQGKEPTIELIAKEVDEDPKEVASVVTRLQGREASLSTPLDDSGTYTLQDAIDSNEQDPEHLVAQYQINRIMEDVTKRFEKTLDNERDLDVWCKHLVSNDPTSLVELGKKYGVSKQRMGQLANRIKKAFRCHIIDELGPYTNLSWLFSDLN